MGTAGPYSELEYLVLGLVAEGFNSGYAIRKTMVTLRGGRWSAESGSVYRVLRRLQLDGMLVELRKAGVPNRERTEYGLTEKGDGVLFGWLSFPPDRTELGYLVDPMRTRAYFLNRLGAEDQIRVLKSWLVESKSFVEDAHASARTFRSIHGDLRAEAYLNLVSLAEARHEWIRHMLAFVRAHRDTKT